VATPIRARDRFPWLGAALILAVTTALYAHTVSHDFLGDDDTQIVTNPAVLHGAPLRDYFFDRDTYSTNRRYNETTYRPLRTLAFRGVALLGGRAGPRPICFGVVNLILYGLSILLVLELALRVSGDRAAATVAAGLWALWSVHVETVVYASALGDQLSSFCELAALWLAARLLAHEGWGRARAISCGCAATVLAAVALYSKEAAVTEVGLLVLGLWLSRVRGKRAWRGVWLAVAWTILTFVYLGMRTLVLGQVGQDPLTFRLFFHGLKMAPVLLWVYGWLTLAPLGHRFIRIVPTPSLAEALLATAGIALVAWLAVRLDRRFRTTGLRFGLGWFVLGLLPVLHLVPVWLDVADRFALVGSVGLAVVVAVLWAALPERRRAPTALALVAALVYSAGTLVEERAWKDTPTLFGHAAYDEPTSYLAHANLAVVLYEQARFADALKEIDLATSLGAHGAYQFVVRAQALDGLGRPALAEAAARRAIAMDPHIGSGHAELAKLLVQRGALDEGKSENEIARQELIGYDPRVDLVEAALAERRGRPDELPAIYTRLSNNAPDDPHLRFLLGRAELANHQTEAALATGRRCLASAPEDGHCACLLGHALLASGAAGPESERAFAIVRARLPPVERDRCLGEAPGR
jgi:tetratricopeptide (TPR) repeat protein